MKTCLVVDDSSVIRKVARRILEGLDFQITEAEDGEKALEGSLRGLTQPILLDWNMPVMHGCEFLRTLSSMPAAAPPMVVLCASTTIGPSLARALPTGSTEYAMNP